MGGQRWWNEDCKNTKRKMRKALRDWRKGKGSKEEYKKLRKGYKG